jgi:uncharacterized protein YciW
MLAHSATARKICRLRVSMDRSCIIGIDLANGFYIRMERARNADMTDLHDTLAVALAGVPRQGKLADALATRANVLAMTQAALEAVLAPREPGAWSHDLRAAIAARVARLNGDEAAAASYAARMRSQQRAPLADPGQDGAAQGLAVVMRFVDRVAARTSQVAAADITALRESGIADADIVRLCELNAFLSYQLRLTAGLRLLQGAAP